MFHCCRHVWRGIPDRTVRRLHTRHLKVASGVSNMPQDSKALVKAIPGSGSRRAATIQRASEYISSTTRSTLSKVPDIKARSEETTEVVG